MNRFSVIIAGGRNFNDYSLLKDKCSIILNGKEDIEIVSGGARGADQLGERYAAGQGYRIKRFLADWNKFGKGAGYIRNRQMGEYSDALICFWDEISKGSFNMIEIAKKLNLLIRIINYV